MSITKLYNYSRGLQLVHSDGIPAPLLPNSVCIPDKAENLSSENRAHAVQILRPQFRQSGIRSQFESQNNNH